MSRGGIAFVLHRPARGGNIGAAARALTTMGFSDLRISGQTTFDEEEAKAWAHGSHRVLESAARYTTLTEALSDRDLVVGTSARRRGDRREYVRPQELLERIENASTENHTVGVALLFGPEDHGLTNEELDLCQIVSEIPMRSSYPSLNLAQAVMVYAYQLSSLAFTAERPHERPIDPASVRSLHHRVRTLLPRLGFDPGLAVTNRIIERIGLAQPIDVNLLHSVVNAIEIHLGGEESPDGAP